MTNRVAIVCFIGFASCWDGQPPGPEASSKLQGPGGHEPYLEFATQEFAPDFESCENGGFSIYLRPLLLGVAAGNLASQDENPLSAASFVSCLAAVPSLSDPALSEPTPFHSTQAEAASTRQTRPRGTKVEQLPLSCGDYPWKPVETLLVDRNPGQETQQIDPAQGISYLKVQLPSDLKLLAELITKEDRRGMRGLWAESSAEGTEAEMPNHLQGLESWAENGDLPNLEVLCLANFGLTNVDWLTKAPKLSHIDLNGNALETIPELSQLADLGFLDLRLNPIKNFQPLIARIQLAKSRKQVFRWRSSWDQYGRSVRLLLP